MALPPAATISISQTLAMLDGPKRELAEGVANDRYVFWLGSGISRERMPDLKSLAKRILISLQGRIDQNDPHCRFRAALDSVIGHAAPSPEECDTIDYSTSPDLWPAFEALAGRLVNNYARMLGVTVEGEEADYLLWDVLNGAAVYSDLTIEPDAEHLCLAALAMEGVASEMPSANWDSLVEKAVGILGGGKPIQRIAIAPGDTRAGRRRTNLYKFHGCARSALEDPAKFRPLLVARQNQINGWVANNPVMANALINLIVTKPTLMLGLSAQDSNIQSLFASAQVQMPWHFPAHPPAYAFAENAVGGDQESLLQNVYHQEFNAGTRTAIRADALVQAFAKPLLLALLLFVLTQKLTCLLREGFPAIQEFDRAKLAEGLEHGRNLVADKVTASADDVVSLITMIGRTMTMLREGALPTAANGLYSPLSAEPLELMSANPNLTSGGMAEFAVALSLVGLGLDRGLWAAEGPNTSAVDSGAFGLVGRSGAAKIFFASDHRAAIRLTTNGLLADNDDAVVVHSQFNPAPMHRSPRRPPGRTGLAPVREVSVEELLAEGTEVEDLLERFRNKVAL
ncbi:hypothetical protein FA04_32925 (plasmid) [Ensifer adhaerens]|uniref:SIR2 family protein n=1 Tax=Ensifer adhaerens TaxID=106592 RepID=A0ABY8HRG3_ENSAD|nr:SIR2 family protein [Ensifer adhaerens]ANK77435.1 hypothetical protein FA04_32925 [Ensifer adhaerens]KDP73013.1 hypothetical protein FA04_14535 [Ensifer adhaerens]WFP94701.1 SIR2 family protein [Ensifer adhaerens]